LIVEDDPAWQQIVGELLEECGLVVDVASSMEEAVGHLRRIPHRLAVVDLSLSDAANANRDGLAVLEAAKRQDPGCATILLTGYATVQLAVQALTDYEALSCLQKSDFDRTDFRKLVDQALTTAPPVPTQSSLTGAPLIEDDAAAHAGTTPPGQTILIVEDDAGWRSILSELLADAGYNVRLCSSYGEASGYLRREAYALAVVDLSLGDVAWDLDTSGGLEGYQLLDLAREKGANTIVVSGITDPALLDCAYEEHGVFACLEKQAFDRSRFVETVSEALAAGEAHQHLALLTPRESEVLGLLAQGVTNKEIAQRLFISTNTVKRHLKSIFAKLDVHTRAAAVAKAVSAGVAPDLS
jgi:DNA-binding NarL/FixJ family response regulator